ncbi:hypothetical protein PVAND_001265 [Polypedilum vanderplanki]|uniref:Uncharacterized protein n=1 Tax=Polypedilum vanderplanki TaxID=319348 RepID=A0A9J6BMZ1_POLVA|nr:hypothetical protein PVAND_001265 [Polypedilum vanderplanki]
MDTAKLIQKMEKNTGRRIPEILIKILLELENKSNEFSNYSSYLNAIQSKLHNISLNRHTKTKEERDEARRLAAGFSVTDDIIRFENDVLIEMLFVTLFSIIEIKKEETDEIRNKLEERIDDNETKQKIMESYTNFKPPEAPSKFTIDLKIIKNLLKVRCPVCKVFISITEPKTANLKMQTFERHLSNVHK